jgi:REP element-mobilizing transposase RayT
MLIDPPGFTPFNPKKWVEIYHRHLPHWRQAGATYFVTFRLADALSREKLQELANEKKAWENSSVPENRDSMSAFVRKKMIKIQTWLDQGFGACVLDGDEPAAIAASAMEHFDDQLYLLFTYIVMPNHVHVVLKPFDGYPLEDILASWKKFSSRRINSALHQAGNLWQEESYDRIVRDSEHLLEVLNYLEKNADQIGRKRVPWICPQWADLLKTVN